MGLPVLRLPSLVFDNIYQFLDVPDIILLSQCSRRAQHLVRSQEGPRTGRQVSVYFYGHYAAVNIVRKITDFCNYLLFTLEIHSSVRKLTDEKSFFNLNIDGNTWGVKKCPATKEWYCVSEEGCYEKDVLTIVKMLRNLFTCSISNIRIVPTNFNFQKLFVETDALHRADKISVDEQRVAPKDMDFMFDHFVTDFLDFRGYGGPEYRYQKSLKFPKLFLDHATWVNLENVFEMTKFGKYVELYEAKLISDKNINQFIKWWLTSDNKTLEFLTIAKCQYSAPPLPGVQPIMNRSVIMEGIETTPGKKKRKEVTKDFPLELKWEKGVEIIRKDGVRATILWGQQTSFGEFFFAVWHHPNPDIDN